MRIKILCTVAALALAGTLGSAARAADQFPQARPLIVDYQRIQTGSKASLDVRRQVEVAQKAFQADVDKQLAGLRKEEAALREQASKLPQADRDAKQKAFEAKVAAAQRRAQERNKAINDAVEEASAKVRKALVPIFSALMERRQANVLLGTSEVLYFEPSMEITDLVLNELDKQMPTLKVDIPDAK